MLYKKITLFFVFIWASYLSAHSQEVRNYQFLYAEGAITHHNKKLIPIEFYEANTEISFKGKIAIFYDTTSAHLYYMHGEVQGKLKKLCVPVAHARGSCYDCVSPLLDFADAKAPYLLLYTDLLLSTQRIEGRQESSNRLEIQNQILIVSLFQNGRQIVKRILPRPKPNYIVFNVGEVLQKYKFDSIVMYKAPESFVQDRDPNTCELITRRQVIWADTALLKKQITPFIHNLRIRKKYFNELEKIKYRWAIYDFIALVQGGIPDSISLERWLKNEFNFDID